MVGLACPESWAPLPNLLHLPQHQLQQRWRVPGSAASCSSSTASEQQHHVQGGLGMLMPARWGSSNSSSSSICGGRNNSGLEQIGMGYCGMPLELLPEFSHHHPQQQQQLGMVGKAAGNSSLSAFLEHRGRQLLHLDDPDIAALQLLHATASGGSHWTRAPDFSPGPSFLSQMQQHSPCCTCDDNMMDEVAVSGTAGGCTTAQQQQVMHWADHIHQVARGGGGGKDAGAAHGGEMEVFSAAAAFQFGDSSCSDYGVHHWLKEAELEEPGPSDLLLDFLHGSSRAGSGGEHELHDCKLIGIQDYLPDLEHEHDDPCRLITTVVGPPPDLGVVSGLSSADAAQEQSPSILSSSPRPIAGPREEEVHASVLASEQLRFGDLGCAAVAMAFKSALPAWPPAHEKMAAEDGGCRQPAGAALSRSSSRRRLSLEQVMPDEPLATPKVGQESPKEKKTSSLAAANAHAARSRRSPKAGKATSSRESAQWTSSNAAVSVDPEEVVLPSTTLLDTSPTPPPPPGDKNERGKRKSSTSSPPAQQKRSRKAATQDGDKEKDKPAQRRAPARTSQAAAASRKRTRQNEQPVEAAAAAEAGEDGQQMDAVVPKKGSKAAAGAGTKRRRTSPATATSPAAAAAPESGCKPQPTKKTRRSPRSARGAAGAAGAKQEEEEEPLPPSSERESHVIAERRRRRSMNFMLSTLGSLLPAEGSTPKATDRLKVVAQTISYIKEMQVSLKALTQKKAELTVAQSLLHSSHHVLAASAKFPEHPSSQTSSTSQLDEAHPSWDNLEAGSCDGAGGCVARKQPSPPVLTLDIFGMEAFITLSCAKSRPDFFCKTLLLLDQLRFKVVTAQKSTNDQMAYHSIHVNNKESEKENKDLKSALERLMNSISTAG